MFLYILFICSLFVHTVQTRYTQPNLAHEQNIAYMHQERMQQFMRAINFTKHGLRCFIKHVYNAKEYADFLANNFFHVTQFMERKTEMPRSYLQSVLRMFGNKIKQSMYVNPYALSELLDEMLPHLKTACCTITSLAYDTLHDNIATTMHDTMLNKFDQLKRDPNAFFANLSHEIITLVGSRHELNNDIPLAELRSTLLLFLQATISRLIWDPAKGAEAWLNVKLIADQLARYHQQGIITDIDDLDDLYTTLLERFYLYLDLSYEKLTNELLVKLRDDIAAHNLLFLEIEHEEYFQSKTERFQQVITDVEIKMRAYQQGIIVA
jgi:hypothetical protein